jgi:hypothetical protein
MPPGEGQLLFDDGPVHLASDLGEIAQIVTAFAAQPLLALAGLAPGLMKISIMDTDIMAMGRYVQTAELSGTVSGSVGGSCRLSSPSGMSGPRRRAGLRKRTTLNATAP